jgi:hypothetical protein
VLDRCITFCGFQIYINFHFSSKIDWDMAKHKKVVWGVVSLRSRLSKFEPHSRWNQLLIAHVLFFVVIFSLHISYLNFRKDTFSNANSYFSFTSLKYHHSLQKGLSLQPYFHLPHTIGVITADADNFTATYHHPWFHSGLKWQRETADWTLATVAAIELLKQNIISEFRHSFLHAFLWCGRWFYLLAVHAAIPYRFTCNALLEILTTLT